MKKENQIWLKEEDLKTLLNYIIYHFDNSLKGIFEELLFLSAKVAEVHGPIHNELIIVNKILKDFI